MQRSGALPRVSLDRFSYYAHWEVPDYYERMSCTVKISCGKNWSGSQRRINSLAEETTCPTSGSASCAGLAGQPTAVVSTTATTSTSTITNTVNPSTLTTSSQRLAPSRPVKSITAKKGEDTTKLLKYIDDNVIGKNGTFFGPFGRRKGQWSI